MSGGKAGLRRRRGELEEIGHFPNQRPFPAREGALGGRELYEIEFYYNGMEYEFEIDAYSGAFRKWECEYDDDHHGSHH